MSGGNPCTCKGKDRRRHWVVVMRHCNYSYFETPKGGKHHSNYSQIRCKAPDCNGLFRTKAKYVDDLPDDTDLEWRRY
jgi:hypothetical protein